MVTRPVMSGILHNKSPTIACQKMLLQSLLFSPSTLRRVHRTTVCSVLCKEPGVHTCIGRYYVRAHNF